MFRILPHISYIVCFASSGFVCGVGCASFFAWDRDTVFFLAGMIALGVCVVWQGSRHVWSVVVFAGLFACGFALMQHQLVHLDAVVAHNSGPITTNARVVGEVVQKAFASQVVVQCEHENFKTILSAPKHAALTHGDIIALTCTRTGVEHYATFDYQKYLATKTIYMTCEDAEYSVVGHDDDMYGWLLRAREAMENIINHVIPAPESALANGLLFGGTARLSEDLQQAFATTGMTHIVAVSGYNVSVIITVLMSVLIFVGLYRKQAVFGAIAGVVLFVALIGFPSSGIRAAIMGVIVLVAASFGRVSHAYASIILSAAVMLAYNPFLLRYDVGFQLSFLATCGIIAMYPLCEKIFIIKKRALSIGEVISMTVSAQIFVIPIIAYHFHTFSVVSLLVNILVLPIIPITMFFVAMIVPLSVVFAPLATLSGWFAYFLLHYEVFIIEFFASLPLSSISVAHFDVLWFAVYYSIMGAVVYYVYGLHTVYEK